MGYFYIIVKNRKEGTTRQAAWRYRITSSLPWILHYSTCSLTTTFWKRNTKIEFSSIKNNTERCSYNLKNRYNPRPQALKQRPLSYKQSVCAGRYRPWMNCTFSIHWQWRRQSLKDTICEMKEITFAFLFTYNKLILTAFLALIRRIIDKLLKSWYGAYEY